MDEKAPRILGEPVKKQTSNPEALLAPGQFSKIYHSESFKPERNDEMKSTKKLLALLLVAMMIVAMLPNALAENAYRLTITNAQAGHTYKVYQIFTGNLSVSGTTKYLSEIDFGSGVTETGKSALLSFGGASYADAAALAKGLTADNVGDFAKLAATTANLGTETKAVSQTAAGDCIITDLAPGYYLVIDSYSDATGEKSDALSKYMVQVVGDATVGSKHSFPTVEKKVKENVKTIADTSNGDGYNDVADYNIGDAVPFHLIGTVPDMSGYDTYKYVFHDTLSNGLTAPSVGTIKVFQSADKIVDDTDTDVTDSFTKGVEGQTITVSIDNLKGIQNIAKGQYIIVEYTATLNTGAVIGLDGNPNTVYLEYSNKPNQSAAGDTDNTGNTPKDKVIVFTYELDTTKVDGQNTETKLKDAKFVLLNAGKNQVAKVDANNKLVGWETVDPENVTTWPAGSELTSDGNGLFKVIGLDAGTYNLREIAAPAGYNLLSQDVEVVITAGTENNQSWNGTPSEALKTLAVTANGTAGTGNPDAGIASITIANNKGNTLPETGGIGTTVFYVLGSILVIGAVVLLVSKKRMNAIE